MATTLTNGTLTVRVIEEITLNGSKRGSVNKHEIRSISEVSERIVNVPTTTVTILSASDTVGPGTYVSSSLKYIRLTNLDDTNFVRVSFASGSSGESNTSDFKLDPQRTMMFTNTSMSGSELGSDFTEFSGFTDLKATADTSSVDLEIFIAST